MVTPRHRRLAGVAIPLFSLRERDDLGSGTILDLIPCIDWCARHDLRLIQLLPINEAAPEEGSPYKALSAFAIDPSYVSVLQLPELADNPAAQAWLATPRIRERISGLRNDHERTRKPSYGIKVRLLEFAFAELERRADAAQAAELERFCRQQEAWLEEYACFRALSERQSFRDWETWPEVWQSHEALRRDPTAEAIAARVRFAKYVQWRAWEQWQQARAYARRAGVWLKGDLAFVCGANSADVWGHPELFDLRSSAGTPPDAFSDTGQLWELPVYKWEEMRRSGYAWWRQRALQAGELYDVFRVDHVVGLYRTFAITLREGGPAGFVPADESIQRQQGHELLALLQQEAGGSIVVGEDLGTVPDWVRDSLHELEIPGYKVFRWEQRDGHFIDPRTYPPASIVTTGTHDTDTLIEWWRTLAPHERSAVCSRLEIEATADLPWAALLLRLLESPAAMAVFPLQDILGWTDRINVPATVGPHNWSFRLPTSCNQLEDDPQVAARLQQLQHMIVATGRLSAPTE